MSARRDRPPRGGERDAPTGTAQPRSPARRAWLVAGAAAGGALLVGCAPSPASRLGDKAIFPARGDEFALNGWVKVSTSGRVVVASPRAEMGQGVHTALAMLVADELDADWASVSVEASPIERIYANAALLLNVVPFRPDDAGVIARAGRAAAQRLGYTLTLLVTGGSSSMRDAWEPMRLAGAAARAMLVEAAARRWSVPAAECSVRAGRVLHAGSGRSAGFGELVEAAARLDIPRGASPKDAQARTLVGTAVPRLDLPSKVDGSAVFGIDVQVPGMLHATSLHAPAFGARIASLDDTGARAMRGVLGVHRLGESTVAVVADRWWRAKAALDALQVGWSAPPEPGLDSAAIGARLRAAIDAGEGSGFRDDGDARAVLARAGTVVSAEYAVPFLAHTTMEPIGCVAQVADGRVTVWAATQVPTFARWKAAQVAGVDVEAVTLHQTLLGGGFGRRLETDYVEEAVALAMRTGGRPVKLVWSRAEDVRHDLYRPAAVARFRAALGDDGSPIAWENHVAAPSLGLDTMTRLLPAMAMDMPDKNHVEGAFELPYAIPNLRVRQHRVRTPVPVGSWRSVGHSYNAFFTECFLDELAAAARRDPLEYRRSLLAGHPRHRAVLDLVAERAGWGTAPAPGRARGLALHESFGSICAQVVEVSVEGEAIRVHRVTCAIDCGLVVNPDTVAAQMDSGIVYGLSAALMGEITVRDGAVEQSNFHDYDALRMAQMPRIDVHIVPSSEPPQGVGEPGTPPVAPALANAVWALTGQRLRALPLRLARLTRTGSRAP